MSDDAKPDIRTRALKPAEVKRLAVLVPEWSDTVYIRALSSGELDDFDKETIRRRKAKAESRGRERMVIATAEDKDGRLIFEAKDEQALSQQPSAVILRLFKAASRFNGLGDEEDGSAPNF